jgi:hypothetical protein
VRYIWTQRFKKHFRVGHVANAIAADYKYTTPRPLSTSPIYQHHQHLHLIMAKEKRKPKFYTAEQIKKLRYTFRKPDTASAIRKDLYGPRHVTYKMKPQQKRRNAKNANHDVGGNAQRSGGDGHGGQTGHQAHRFRPGSMLSMMS